MSDANATHRAGQIAIVGRPNVGKSTLLNRLVGQKVAITSNKAQTTRHRILGIRSDAHAQFVFVDTPGFQTRNLNALNRVLNRTVSVSLADVDVAMLVTEGTRFGDADRAVLQRIPAGLATVLVINKIDRLRSRDELLPFIERISREHPFAAIVPLSAESGSNCEELLRATAALLPEGPSMFDEEQVTDRSERFIAAELIREKLFRLLGQELPYVTAVVIDDFREEGGLRRIHATIFVERPNQKAIVIGKAGAKLKAVATQAREDMERVFGGKVHLEVWVKTRRGWADDERALRAFGYE